MLIPERTTAVPNAVFDYWMPKLKPTALCVLLIIIRQTLGRAKDKEKADDRKEKDWISSSQLQEKTRYSRRALSCATEVLVRNKLIRLFDEQGNILDDPEKRKGRQRMYYAPTRDVLNSSAPAGIIWGERVHTKVRNKKQKEIIAQDLRNKCAGLAIKYRITK